MKINKGKLMRRILILIILVIAANVYLANSNKPEQEYVVIGQDSVKVITPEHHMAKLDELINTLLSRYHYKKFDLNDSLSSVIFDRYIQALDYNRSYFFASDIKSFDKYRYQLDDDFKNGDIQPEYDIYNLFVERMNNRIDYVHELLKKGFDFSKNESYAFKRDSADWPKNQKEMDELWRKKVKNDALNLLLTGKDWPSIVKTLGKRYENYRRAYNQLNSQDVFQIAMNSYTGAIDPHTTYLSPISKDNFNIDMARSLEGIGAQLTTEDEYTKVAKIIAGGPAFKSKLLHNGDKITGVAQGEDGEMVDVIGWRLNDVVKLIRGDKGTIVRLQILPASEGVNATPKEIKLTRDKVKLNEMSAKMDTLDIKDNNTPFRFGVITLPTFYSDFAAKAKGDKNYKSTTRDIKNLLIKLKKEKVDGVIIDLRNNGGGSLQEVISLVGLFIKNGPVVQVKNADGSIEVDRDPDPGILYDGPMAVMVNRFSASASEIFTAAIQDYGRGIIVGENTYGKGTVQNGIDLNRIVPESDNKFGQINLTIAKFYRVTGNSTQNLGVTPDIQFPSAYPADKFGESSQASALPWDKIKSSNFTQFSNIKKYIPALEKKHEERIKDNPDFQELIAHVNHLKESMNKHSVSLNQDVRKKEKEEQEAKKLALENAVRKREGLKLLKKGEVSKNESKNSDAELDETGHILADYIIMTIG